MCQENKHRGNTKSYHLLDTARARMIIIPDIVASLSPTKLKDEVTKLLYAYMTNTYIIFYIAKKVSLTPYITGQLEHDHSSFMLVYIYIKCVLF